MHPTKVDCEWSDTDEHAFDTAAHTRRRWGSKVFTPTWFCRRGGWLSFFFFSFHPFWISNCKSVKTKARYSHYPGERHQGGMTRILRRHLRATSIATISDRFVVFCVRVLASFIITSAWREALYIKKNLGYFPSLWWIYLDTSVRCNHKPKKYIYNFPFVYFFSISIFLFFFVFSFYQNIRHLHQVRCENRIIPYLCFIYICEFSLARSPFTTCFERCRSRQGRCAKTLLGKN